MGNSCSSESSLKVGPMNEADLKILKMRFDALANRHSADGYILKEDFLYFFKIPGLLGERLFIMFDKNRDNKLYWSDFTDGIGQCMFSNEEELDDFIFHFFCLNGHSIIDFEEFQSIMQHLPPSVFFVVVRSADNRSHVVQKWVEQYGNQMNELPQDAIYTGIGILLEAYFQSNEDDTTTITYHSFTVFLREQPSLREYFSSIFRIVTSSVHPTPTPLPSHNTQSATTPKDYNPLPFDTIDPEVYRTRNTRSIQRSGHPEKWSAYTRAYWSIACNFCHKEVRFCCMCQGELKPLDRSPDDSAHHLQCAVCNRMISMRFCSACGHQFEERVVEARMEIPGFNSEVKELCGDLYQPSHFNSTTKVYARIHNNFLYLFANRISETPLNVTFLEKVVVKKMADDKNPKYFGFVLQFPAAYEKYLYCTSEHEREVWMKTIEDVSGVRKIEDYYDLREKIGEGRFAMVYRGVDKKNLKEYAVKVVNKKNLTDKERELIQTEVAILSLVQHKRIVTLIETFESNEYLYIVMELLRGGELYHNICGRSILSEEEAFQIIIPLAECLSYMHSMGIIHRDIKPENILCDKNLYDVKIGDFGFSQLIFPKEKLDYPCGTLNYIAPEVIARQGYTTKADMWSLGIIFYLLMRGRLPFDGKSKEEVLDQVIHGVPDYNNRSFLRLSSNCKNVIKGLLQKNPDLRLSADDLLHHPWVEEMKEEKAKVEESPLSDADWVRPEESIPSIENEGMLPCGEKASSVEEDKQTEDRVSPVEQEGPDQGEHEEEKENQPSLVADAMEPVNNTDTMEPVGNADTMESINNADAMESVEKTEQVIKTEDVDQAATA